MPPLDARERMIVPLAGAVMVFAAAAYGFAASAEKGPLAVVTLTGAAALVEVLVRDAARLRWLERAFDGHGPFAVVPSADVPAVAELPAYFGGVPTEAAVVRIADATYRAAARVPLASTACTVARAAEPLEQRRLLALFLLAFSSALAVAWFFAR